MFWTSRYVIITVTSLTPATLSSLESKCLKSQCWFPTWDILRNSNLLMSFSICYITICVCNVRGLTPKWLVSREEYECNTESMFSLSGFPSTLNIYITKSSSYTQNIVLRLKLTGTTEEHRMGHKIPVSLTSTFSSSLRLSLDTHVILVFCILRVFVHFSLSFYLSSLVLTYPCHQITFTIFLKIESFIY